MFIISQVVCVFKNIFVVLNVINYCKILKVVHYCIPWWLSGKTICLQCRGLGLNPWVRKIPWRGEQLPTPKFLPGECHGQRSLADYSPCVHKELNMTEQLTHTAMHTHIYTHTLVIVYILVLAYYMYYISYISYLHFTFPFFNVFESISILVSTIPFNSALQIFFDLLIKFYFLLPDYMLNYLLSNYFSQSVKYILNLYIIFHYGFENLFLISI